MSFSKLGPRRNGELREGEYALRELLREPNGFERYAAEKMPEFIQVVRDYEGFVRDVLTVTEITPDDVVRLDGEVFVTYSLDIDGIAGSSSKYGETPSMYAHADTIKVGIFELETPRITITQLDLDTQPYDIMRRAQEKCGQEVSKREDQTFLDIANLILAQPEAAKQIVRDPSTDPTKPGLLAIKQVFSRNSVAFAAYLMNPATYDTFLLWGREELDTFSQKTVFETGQLPTIWGGIRFVTSITVPENQVYGLAPKEILGRMPILRDITTKVQEIPETKDREVLAFEYIGMFIHSHLCIVRLDLGVTGDPSPTPSP